MSAELVRVDAAVLERIGKARALLERSRDLDEVKSIRDVALAAEQYARAKELGEESQRFAAEIAVRAERRYGQLLTETPRKQPKPGTASEPGSTPRQRAGKKLSARSQRLAQIEEAEFEELIEKTRKLSADRLARIQRDKEAERRRIEQARQDAEAQPKPSTVDIRHGDFREVLAELRDVDAVITDPPYPFEYLPLLDDLAAWADKVLTPDGVLAVLFGQTYLPEVYRRLDGHRPYRWTACYLTQGSGYASQARRLQCHWKPLLIYGGGPRFDDVIRSEGSNAAAKDNHRWGQDYAAFHTIVERLTSRGQTIVDPFMGSGTTLLAAHALGRHAIGCDIDPESVAKAKERLT